MTTSLNTLIAMTALALALPMTVSATELNYEYAYEDQTQTSIEGDDKGFAYQLAGDPEEEGAMKLFVKSIASKHDVIDPAADRLNAISPAAGIQIDFEF